MGLGRSDSRLRYPGPVRASRSADQVVPYPGRRQSGSGSNGGDDDRGVMVLESPGAGLGDRTEGPAGSANPVPRRQGHGEDHGAAPPGNARRGSLWPWGLKLGFAFGARCAGLHQASGCFKFAVRQPRLRGVGVPGRAGAWPGRRLGFSRAVTLRRFRVTGAARKVGERARGPQGTLTGGGRLRGGGARVSYLPNPVS